MNRDLWISKNLNEYFPCPHCGKGVLELKEFKEFQTPESKRDDLEIVEAGLGPGAYILFYYFWAMLKCIKCKEPVICSGDSHYTRFYEDQDNPPTQKELLKPRYVLPPLKIIDVPINTPDKLKEEIQSSFELFWVNESACANSIRKVLEFLLDEEEVPRIGKGKKGKDIKLDLHKRIQQYKKVNEELLLAVKEIGNAGSHQRTTVEFVLDGYDLLEHVLEILYTDKHGDYMKLAKKVVTQLKNKE